MLYRFGGAHTTLKHETRLWKRSSTVGNLVVYVWLVVSIVACAIASRASPLLWLLNITTIGVCARDKCAPRTGKAACMDFVHGPVHFGTSNIVWFPKTPLRTTSTLNLCCKQEPISVFNSSGRNGENILLLHLGTFQTLMNSR